MITVWLRRTSGLLIVLFGVAAALAAGAYLLYSLPDHTADPRHPLASAVR